jgi:soluble lytic murein transglycosylase-like protein
LGTRRVLDTLRRAGLSSLTGDASTYGLGLVLGVGEVTLLDLTSAYAGLARSGVYREPRWVRAATDARGRALALPEDNASGGLFSTKANARGGLFSTQVNASGSAFPTQASAGRRWTTPAAAFQVADILTDDAARIPGFGTHSALDLPFPVAVKTASAEYRLKQAMARAKRISNNTADAELKRFDQTIVMFEKYGKQYGFDPLMLAAQGFQESQLRQDMRGPTGAIGIMQVMPATGAELKVGDIKIAENNIHAGAKYMDQLMDVYFKDANFSEAERPLFAFASYNAGPGRISSMRKEAAKRGLNPDKWFHNVEIVTAEKVGIETTTYVRNIFKYYTAYRLALDAQLEQKRARESIAPKN